MLSLQPKVRQVVVELLDLHLVESCSDVTVLAALTIAPIVRILMTRAATRRLPEIGATALAVRPLMTLCTPLPFVLPSESPPGEAVIEAVTFAAGPPNEGGPAASVLDVTPGAVLSPVVSPVEPGSGLDASAEGFVTGEATARAHLPTFGVASVALVTALDVRVVARELSRREKLS
jgi:hypothetical protein